MKYMGSKRMMLVNGLGDVIRELGRDAPRFVDLFCGSGAVSWYAAQHLACPVLSVDLQAYAVALASAVITRTEDCALEPIDRWLDASVACREDSHLWHQAVALREADLAIGDVVLAARQLCSGLDSAGAIWQAYGGYYFAPWQALTLDSLLATLPDQPEHRAVAVAAVIQAASQCAAAPGHTAQPLQPTARAGAHIADAWKRDPISHAQRAATEICHLYAHTAGAAVIGDAQDVASELDRGDVVFVDPPYSAVQYSRFYHVLETVARGDCGTVSGAGRYPPQSERPCSDYSLKSKARGAVQLLLGTLANRGCRVIVTYPAHICSNGLSSHEIAAIARQWFMVSERDVHSHFSTLGGSDDGSRRARQSGIEKILVLTQ